VQITGETMSSSKLIEILEQSQLLRNATPRGTETRGSAPNSVRFMIVAEVRQRPQPDVTPVLAGAAAPGAAATITAPPAAAPASAPPPAAAPASAPSAAPVTPAGAPPANPHTRGPQPAAGAAPGK
jgi:hypothetical protein